MRAAATVGVLLGVYLSLDVVIDFFRWYVAHLAYSDWNSMVTEIGSKLGSLCRMLLIPALLCFFAAVVVGLAQTRLWIGMAHLRFSLGRVWDCRVLRWAGIMRRALLGGIWVVATLGMVWMVVHFAAEDILNLLTLDASYSYAKLSSIVLALIAVFCGLCIGFGLLAWLSRRFLFLWEYRMTELELRNEAQSGGSYERTQSV